MEVDRWFENGPVNLQNLLLGGDLMTPLDLRSETTVVQIALYRVLAKIRKQHFYKLFRGHL